MRAVKKFRSVTQAYDVLDGPVVETDPKRLSKGRFRVEYMAVTWHDGNVSRVFIRGQAVLADGRAGKNKHDRTLLASELPDWMDEYLDISL